MGLKKINVELESGINSPEVYYNIGGFHGNKSNVTYGIVAYASYESYMEGKPVLFRREYTFPRTEGDIYDIGYSNLKILDEFKDAEDVIENN